MSQPTYSSATGYVSEQFFTVFFDIAIDAANPPLIGAFNVQINGTGTTVSAVEVDSTDKSVKITFTANALTPGDIIEFSYQDPTGGNDVNAVQGLDGTDAATFSASTVVMGARPGPSAPPVPTLDSGSDSATLGDHITSDNTPTLSGTSDANATVKLYDTDGTTLLGTTTADGSGNWSITSSQLSDASHTLKVTQTNSSSQTSPLSTGLTLKIDTVANAPTTLAVAAGSDSGTLGDGISNAGTPVITGVGEANATVRLYDTDTTLLGTAMADGSGKWSITSGNLIMGSHTLTAKQTDAAGNVSAASSGFSYTVDTIGPVGMALSTTSVPVAGATNGSTVATLSSTDITSVAYGFAVGNGSIDADNGKFSITGTSLTAAQNLSAGAYHIYLKATDAAGNDAFQIFVVNVTNAPTISSIVRAGSASATVPASDTSVNYTVTFSESVTGVDISDFTLTPGSTASGAISGISGSGSTYTVTVDTLGGDGTLRLDLNASGTGIKNGSSVDITGGAYTAGQTYSLDHTAPTAPSTPAMTAGTDTGASSSDAITTNTTPVFTGTGEANATVNLYDTDGTTLLGTATADGSGKWSITSSALSSGPHTVSVKQVDAAGNVSGASSSLAVQIDTSVPTAPATPVLSPGSDSGVSGDLLTNVVTPVITGTAEANATVKLYDTDGTTLLGTTTADGSGKWSITSSTLSSASHTLTVKQTDVAGNVSPASSSLVLTVDTSVPTTPGTAALQTASDSGTLGDGITKITTPTLIGTGTIGDTVTLYDTNGTTVLGTAVVDGSGNWSITSSTLSDAVHSVTVKQTNPAGTASSASTAFNLTIDSTAPNAPSTPAMTAGTDTGASSSDAITSNVTPVFTGTAEANATVKLYDTDGTTLLGTATADGSGKWSITSSTLASGPHTLSVKQTDAAGNVSGASSTLAVEIDNTAPTAPATPVLSPGSDSGVSGDLLTNVVTPVITGTAEANATVKLYDTDGTTLLGTTTADGSGKWSITSSTLSSASHTLTVKQTDAAGNVSGASSSLVLTVDTSVPTTPATPALQTASDSGTLGDGITKITAPTLIGTGTVGDTVTLYDTNGTTVLGTAVVDGSGNWSITSSSLSDAVHSVTVKQTNPAGTVSSASSAFNLTIDSGAPTAPSAPVMTSGTDTGTLGDGITSNVTPVFTGTAEANATVKLYDTDGTTLLGTATADGSGKWSITSSTLSTGPHTLSVKQSDAAGNVSAASSTLAVDIDTTAPTAPATPLLSPGSDSGVSGDLLTNVVTPVITGTAEANATVKLYDTDGTTLLGTTTADGSGKWSITSSTLSSTSHSLTVKQTDVAGNVSSASSALVLNVDTSVPTTPATPALQTASDSGTLGDGITKITAPTLTGTGTKGDTVTLYDTNGTTVLGTAVVDGSGNWSITSSTLSEAVHSLTVKQTNPAGTASSASTAFNLTIDSTAPGAPGTPSLQGGSDSNIVGDRITNVITPTVSGTAVANALLTLYDSDGSTVLGTTTADGNGNWSITSSKLGDGPHSLQAKQSDAAGNQSVAGGSLQLTVDTSVPSALNLSASKVTTTAGSNAIVGTLSSIDSADGGGFSYALVAGTGATDNALFTIENGVLHIKDPATAGTGEHSIRVSTTDVAGNTLEKVLSITVYANQPPVVSGLSSSTQTILAGTPVALNQLTISDPDSSDLSVTLTVSNGVINNVKDADAGTPGIQLTGTPAQIAAALAQATFVTLEAGNASLGISVTDHVIANPVSASFQFKVTPPALVDGVPVVAFPVILPGGGNGNSVYVPTVTTSRVDDTGNSTLADIPLVTENSNNILSAHVPTGFGLTSSGGASQSAGSSLDHLIAAIIASTPNNEASDQAHLTGNGQNFLSLLPSAVPLLVQTVKPSSGATAPTQALQLNGNSTTTQHTALVIDASQLPDGSSINLQQVDFAAVVGNANINGTTNGQILTGDAGNQHFTVGTGQTSQVFSGAGSDTLQFGTAPGLQAPLAIRAQAPLDSVSLLHGGSGLDNAVFTLGAASYHVTQHDGYALVTNLATPSQQVQLVNVESVKFADQTVTLEHRAELNTLAGMYVSILGRQADVGGFDYWGALQQGQTGLGEIAVAMMNTAEGHGKGFSFNGQSTHDVEQLYKGLFNRASDAEGLAYWSHLMDNGTLTLVGVANAFIAAQEMNAHKLAVTGWDFQV